MQPEHEAHVRLAGFQQLVGLARVHGAHVEIDLGVCVSYDAICLCKNRGIEPVHRGNAQALTRGVAPQLLRLGPERELLLGNGQELLTLGRDGIEGLETQVLKRTSDAWKIAHIQYHGKTVA